MTALEEIPIIDIDAHYTEPADLWTSRAPAALRDQVLRVETDDDGNHRWVVGRDIILGPLGFTVVRRDGSKLEGDFSLDEYEEMSEAAYDPKARLRLMDGQGVWGQILYPNALGFAGHGVMRVEDEALRRFCLTGYNDAMAELVEAGGGRLLPQAVLPFWDIDLCVSELRRAKEELGLTGFTMTDAPEQWDLPALHDPHWDPLWDTAQGLSLPVNFHIGAGTPPGALSWPGYEMGRTMASTSVLMIMSNMRCITNLICSGLLDRYPSLDFVSVESGVGWLPFLMEAIEYQIDENMGPDRGGLELRPSEYFRRQIYASYWFEKQGLAPALELLGEDNVMFETDFPHPTCLYPDVQGQVKKSLSGLPTRVQKKVLYETAARVYGLEVPSP